VPDYRRLRIPGGCYFFTVNLRDRRSNLLVTRIDALRAADRRVQCALALHHLANPLRCKHNNITISHRNPTVPDYRRLRIPGGCYFFTVNLRDRRSNLLVTRIDTLRAAIKRVQLLMPFHIDACVVLPDHIHAIWTFPEGDAAFSARWQAIKMAFSKAIEPGEALSTSRAMRGERGIWQRRFWEHAIRDEQDYTAHVDYVHFNPVKQGLAATAAAWPHSTFHRAVAQGLYPRSWAGEEDDDAYRGERSNT
jgi:putative transposase